MVKAAGILKATSLTMLVTASVLISLFSLTPVAISSDSADLGRADAYVAQVEARMTQRAEAALDARTVAVRFPQARPLQVLILGDAITLGASASTVKTRYREVLDADLGKHGAVEMTVIASSKQGGTVKAGQLAPQVPASKAFDVVLVAVGTNESASSDLASYSLDYPALIDAARAGSPEAGLLCVGAWGDKKSTERFDKLTEETCGQRGGRFRPLSSLFQIEKNRWANKLMPDGRATGNFFPSDLGHAAIAKIILEALRISDAGASASTSKPSADQQGHSSLVY